MYRKCNSNIVAKNYSNVTDHVTFTEKWYAFYNISSHCVIMCKHSIKGVLFAPLYIHSVKLLQAYALLKTKKLYSVYNENSLPQNTSDKLKYYRYKRGLLQREVANFIGVDRKTYSAYESGLRNYYPLDKLSLLQSFLKQILKTCLMNIILFYIMDKAARSDKKENHYI